MERGRATLNLPALAGIFSLAVIVRLVALMLLGPRLGGDSASYISRARQVVEGGPLAIASLPLEHSPLYSIFLVPGLAAGLDVIWYATIVQAFLGALTACLIALITLRGTASTTAALLAGLVAGIHLTFPFWGVYVLSDTVFLFVLALTVERLLALDGSHHPLRDASVAGCLLLLSVGSRPTAAPFALGLIVFLVVLARRDVARFVKLAIGLATPAIVVVAVWFGAATLGRAPSPVDVGGRAATWANSAVFVGLVWTEEGRATFGVDIGVDPRPVLATMSADERATFERIDIGQQPFAFVAAQPAFFAQQAVRKAKLFWSPVLPEFSTPHRAARVAYFVPLYVLALGGFVISIGRRPAFATLMLLGVATFTLTCMVTFVDYDQRYRLPVELFLIPLAGAGLAWLVARRWKPAWIADGRRQVASDRI